MKSRKLKFSLKKNSEIVFLGRYKSLLEWLLYLLYEVIHLLPLRGCVTGLTVVDGVVTPSGGRTTPEGSEVG